MGAINRVHRGDVLTAAKMNQMIDAINHSNGNSVIGTRTTDNIPITVLNNNDIGSNLEAGEIFPFIIRHGGNTLPSFDEASTRWKRYGFQLECITTSGGDNAVYGMASESIPHGEVGNAYVHGIIVSDVRSDSSAAADWKYVKPGSWYPRATGNEMEAYWRVVARSLIEDSGSQTTGIKKRAFCYMVPHPVTHVGATPVTSYVTLRNTGPYVKTCSLVNHDNSYRVKIYGNGGTPYIPGQTIPFVRDVKLENGVLNVTYGQISLYNSISIETTTDNVAVNHGGPFIESIELNCSLPHGV